MIVGHKEVINAAKELPWLSWTLPSISKMRRTAKDGCEEHRIVPGVFNEAHTSAALQIEILATTLSINIWKHQIIGYNMRPLSCAVLVYLLFLIQGVVQPQFVDLLLRPQGGLAMSTSKDSKLV